MLSCSASSDPENVKHIGWYRCSTDDCEHDCDKFLIAHVQNVTEKIADNPNFNVYTNRTLAIKKVLPADGEKMFICISEEKYIGRKRSTTILHAVKGDNSNTNSIQDNNNGNLAVDNSSGVFYCLRFPVPNDVWNVIFWGGGGGGASIKYNWRTLRKNKTGQGREATETHLRRQRSIY